MGGGRDYLFMSFVQCYGTDDTDQERVMVKKMEYKQILCERKGFILTISLNRPDRLNALNNRTIVELRQAFADARRDNEVKVVVVTGRGDSFCVGRDLQEYREYDATPVNDWEWRQSDRFAFNSLDDFEKPVIAAVNGLCYAGGFELAAVCDIRVASETARFALPEIRAGIFPGGGATWLLPRLVGKGTAMRMILTGGVLDATEAKNVGLVDFVVPPDELEDHAGKLAEEIASKSLAALMLAKAAVNLSLDKDSRSGMKITAALRALAESTDECREGIEKFSKKYEKQYHTL